MIRKGTIAAGCLVAALAAAAQAPAAVERRAGSTFDAALTERVGKKMSVEVTDVRCPARVAVAKGNTFRCTLSFGSGDVSGVIVKLRDRSGRFTWRLVGLLLRDLETHMEHTMVEMRDPGEVQCPWRRRVREGDTFRCFGLNTARTRAYNFDAVQIGGGIVRYTVTERP